MGLLKTMVYVGVGTAIGLGVGYGIFKPTPVNCQQVYKDDLARFETQNEGIPATKGVARAQDFSLEYIASKNPEFKGTVLKDQSSGKYQVLARTSILGTSSYSVVPVEGLDAILTPGTPKIELQPQVKNTYNLEKVQEKTP